jgi:hypothetical protein
MWMTGVGEGVGVKVGVEGIGVLGTTSVPGAGVGVAIVPSTSDAGVTVGFGRGVITDPHPELSTRLSRTNPITCCQIPSFPWLFTIQNYTTALDRDKEVVTGEGTGLLYLPFHTRSGLTHHHTRRIRMEFIFGDLIPSPTQR